MGGWREGWPGLSPPLWAVSVFLCGSGTASFIALANEGGLLCPKEE